MPTSEAPADLNEPQGAPRASTETDREDSRVEEESSATAALEPSPPAGSTSRWINYDTHELLEMIGELEDERRWSRLREGILWAVLFHILLISAITWIPIYVFKQPKVINPFDVLKQRQLTYLNLPPSLEHTPRARVKIKPIPPVDKQTLQALNHPPAAPPTPAPPVPVEKAPQVKQPPSQPVPPSPKSQVEAPRPAAVPRPNFAMGAQSPVDQLQQDMRNVMHGRSQGDFNSPQPGGLAMHPGAGAGGVQILTPTNGVDFSYWLQAWYYDTEHTWDPLIPDEVNPPIDKAGQVQIRFKVLPNGRVMDGSMVLEGSSGDTALDRAAWGAISGSSYPPLPRAFHGPYLELRALFLYNMQPPQ
ncbi:MAG: energy transducer TonB family protein [Terracidiphilus sp.]